MQTNLNAQPITEPNSLGVGLPRTSRAPVFFETRGPSVLGDDTPSALTYEALEAYALSFHAPWYQVMLAQLGANHDWVYNHDLTDSPDWIRGANADVQQANPLRKDLLSWIGAVDLFRLYEHQRDQGREIDFKRFPAQSAQIIKEIVDTSQIDNAMVWSFFVNLDRIMKEQGTTQYMRPSIASAMADLPNIGKIILWGVLGLVGLVVFVKHEL